MTNQMKGAEADFLHPDDFIEKITNEIDQYFQDAGYNEMWLTKDEGARDPEEVSASILNRLMVGFYNEVYIRDSVMHTLEIAPDVKTQQALMQQVQDEHNHAIWIINLLNKRGYDPRKLGKTPSRGYEMFWDYLFGHATRASNAKDPHTFLNIVATTQLVNERLFGLRATAVFAESIANYDEEVAELYGNKIRKDEIFHTLNLPEMILKKHATSPEAQQAVREGVERSKIFLKIISDEMRGLQKHRGYDHAKI